MMKKTVLASAVLLALTATSAFAETHDYTSTYQIYRSDQQHVFDLTAIDNNLFRVVTASGRAFDQQTNKFVSFVGEDAEGKLVGTVHLESANNRALMLSKAGGEIKADTVTLLGGGSIALEAYGNLKIVTNNLNVGGTANYGVVSNDVNAKVQIEADNATISGAVVGVYSANGDVSLEANDLTIKSQYAIYSQKGNTSVKVNGIADINGDVYAVGSKAVDLSITEGQLNGSFVTGADAQSNLVMGKDAVWTLGKTDSNLTTLKSEGTIDMSKTDANLLVSEAFEGAVVKVDAAKTNTLTVEGEATGEVIVVATDNADKVTAEQAAAMVERMSGVAATATVEEGMYNGAMNVDSNGTVAVKVNTLMSNVLDMASAQSLSMNRILMNDVRKRLGNIRSAEGTHGVWARYDGGRLSGANAFENDFHTLQFGIDTVPAADAPRFGVAFSYTQSDADLKRGGAEMDAFGLAAYATKMYDNGAFIDVIGRIATADTDVVVDGDKKGSMDNLAVSLSAEAGWRFNMTERHYVEPQVEVTYTRVNNSDLALSNGSAYGFDNVDSVIGRAGFAAGFTCPNNMGDVYVRASVVREFMGDAMVRGGRAVLELDGGDTWYEYGIGANFNINKNTYVYADVERTGGATLDEDWRANVGVRYSF